MTPAQRHLYKRILLRYREVIDGIITQCRKKRPPQIDGSQATILAAAPEVVVEEVEDVEMVDTATSAPHQDRPTNGNVEVPVANGSALDKGNGKEKANGDEGTSGEAVDEESEQLPAPNSKPNDDGQTAASNANGNKEIERRDTAVDVEMDLD